MLYDAPGVSEPSSIHAPYQAPDNTTPEAMRKAKWLGTWNEKLNTWENGSWVDEEAAELAAILKEQEIQAIKVMAGQIITTRIPEWKQRNLIARKTELQDQYIDNVPFSTEERAEWDAMAEAWEWVKNVRAASDWAEINKTPVDEIIWPTLRSDLKL